MSTAAAEEREAAILPRETVVAFLDRERSTGRMTAVDHAAILALLNERDTAAGALIGEKAQNQDWFKRLEREVSEEARKQEWCGEFENFMEKAGLTPVEMLTSVSVRTEFDITIVVPDRVVARLIANEYPIIDVVGQASESDGESIVDDALLSSFTIERTLAVEKTVEVGRSAANECVCGDMSREEAKALLPQELLALEGDNGDGFSVDIRFTGTECSND